MWYIKYKYYFEFKVIDVKNKRYESLESVYAHKGFLVYFYRET